MPELVVRMLRAFPPASHRRVRPSEVRWAARPNSARRIRRMRPLRSENSSMVVLVCRAPISQTSPFGNKANDETRCEPELERLADPRRAFMPSYDDVFGVPRMRRTRETLLSVLSAARDRWASMRTRTARARGSPTNSSWRSWLAEELEPGDTSLKADQRIRRDRLRERGRCMPARIANVATLDRRRAVRRPGRERS